MNTIKHVTWSTRVANKLFILYTVYLSLLWMLLNYGGNGIDPYTGGGYRWYLITIPLLLFVFVCLVLFCFDARFKADPILLFLLLYLVGVGFTSLINLDLKHFSEAARWAIPVMAIVHFRLSIPLKVLNGLFLLAIVILVVNYDPAISSYGYMPGQTSANLHQGMWWRISIWIYHTAPYSAAFSILVFFANYFFNPGRSRYIFYILALYFIILSGSRTSYFIFLLCFSLVWFLDARNFRLRLLYRLIPFCTILIIAGLQLFVDLIFLLNIENEVFNSALLRNDGTEQDSSNLSSRIKIILEHWKIMQGPEFNYGLGVGSFVYDSPEWASNGGFLGGSTDSYVSHLVARDGVSILFLMLSFYYFFIAAMKERNLFGYIILLMLLIYTIGYGAWLNLTSPVFVLFLGSIYYQSNLLNRQKVHDQPQ